MFQQIIDTPVGFPTYDKDFKDIDYPKDELGNPIDGMVVDQFYSQPFVKAENGFPKSDIAAFFDAQSQELKEQISQRMTEIKAQYPDQELSDDILAKMTIPRSCQTQQSFRDWAASIDELGFNKAIDAEIAKIQAQRVSDPNHVSDPDPIKFEGNEGNIVIE